MDAPNGGKTVANKGPSGLLALVILAAAYWRKVRLEERHLNAVFGAEYNDYRKKSWAMIPWLL